MYNHCGLKCTILQQLAERRVVALIVDDEAEPEQIAGALLEIKK